MEETSYEANNFHFYPAIFFFLWNPFSLLYSWKCAHSIDCGMWSLLLQVLFPFWHFMTWSSHQASLMPWCILCTWSTPALFTQPRRGFLWPLDLWKSLRWYQLSFKKHISFLPEITFTLIFFPKKIHTSKKNKNNIKITKKDRKLRQKDYVCLCLYKFM